MPVLETDPPLGLGSEIIVRSTLSGGEEQLFEVDQFITNHRLSLVGAYSVRRRLDFRIERKTRLSRMSVKLSYPSYHGRFGAWLEQWRSGRKLDRALDEGLMHFKGLVEYRSDDSLLADL